MLITFLLTFYLIFSPFVYAETSVKTSVESSTTDGSVESTVNTTIESSGDSQSNVSVENKVESTGSVYKKTEVIINGEKKIIESTKPGVDKIQITIEAKKKDASPTGKLKLEDKKKEIKIDKKFFGERLMRSIKELVKGLFK